MVNFARPEFTFTRQNFAEKLTVEFPIELDEITESGEMCYMQMFALYRYAEQVSCGDKSGELGHCMRFVEKAAKEGSPDIKDAVYTSFLEHVEKDTAIYIALTPKLRQMYDEAGIGQNE